MSRNPQHAIQVKRDYSENRNLKHRVPKVRRVNPGHILTSYAPNPRYFGVPIRDYLGPREEWVFDQKWQRMVLRQTTMVPYYLDEFYFTQGTGYQRPHPNELHWTKRVRVAAEGNFETTELDSSVIPAVIKPVSQRGYIFGPLDGPSQADTYFRLNPLADVVTLKERALQKVMDQLRGKSDLAQDVAEGRSTARMISRVNPVLSANPFEAVANGLNRVADFTRFLKKFLKSQKIPADLARLPKGGSKDQKILDWLTDRWLEVEFGWKPLIQSIFDAFDTAVVRPLHRNPVVTYRGRAQKSERFVGYVTVTGGTYASKGLLVESYTLKVHTSMTFDIGTLPPLADWTTLNPVSLVWATTRLSFVVDWIVDISRYLRQIETSLLYDRNFLYGSETLLSIHSGNLTLFAMGGAGSCKSSYRETSLSRVLLTHIPTFQLRVKPRVGSQQLFDAAALFHQLIARKAR